MMIKTGLGQDSHRFEEQPTGKRLMLGGVHFEGDPGLEGNSDSDPVLHALVNAITGIHGTIVLGPKTDEMCQSGITDSKEYVNEALRYLGKMKICHVSISLECARPKIGPRATEIRTHIAELLSLTERHIAITAHTGERLSAVGKGDGIFATVIVTAMDEKG